MSSSIPHAEFMSDWTIHTKTMSIFVLIIKTSGFRPAHKKQVKFNHPHNQMIFIPTLKWSQVRSSTLRSSQFRPSQKTKQILMLTPKTSNFQSAHKRKVNFDPRTKTSQFSALKRCPFSTPKIKPSWFRPQRWSRVHFYPHSKNHWFCMPSDANNKCISI